MKPIKHGNIRMDARGDGHYGAPRGDRRHNGVDYTCVPGQAVLSPCSGTVKRWGYPYVDAQGLVDPKYMLIVIDGDDGSEHKVMYIKPTAPKYWKVAEGDTIGYAQDVSQKWGSDMLPHIHWEVKIEGERIDPEDYTWQSQA